MPSDTDLLAALHASAPASELLAAAEVRERADPTPDGLADRCKAAIAAVPYEYTVRRYACPFCRNFSRSKREPVVVHIARCWRNPAVRACLTCAHFRRERPEPEVGLFGGEFCDAQEIELVEGIQDGCPLWAARGGEAA